MDESSKLAIAGIISVSLRRKLNRVIDVEWMLHNETYAKEVIRLSRQQGLAELNHYADRMEELILGKVPAARTVPAAQDIAGMSPARHEAGGETGIESQYIGALR